MKNRALGLLPARKRNRFVRDQRGASAVEFALIAPLFFGLTFSIIEAGWYFFVNSAVDASVSTASRLIRTGQAQDTLDKTAFFDEICDVVKLFGDCTTQLTVDVERFDDFSDLAGNITAPTCSDAPPAAQSGIPYNPGAQRDIVMVRVCFLYKTLNPAINLVTSLKLDETGNGEKKLIAMSIFRNEPYED